MAISRRNRSVRNLPTWFLAVTLTFLILFAGLVWVHYSAATQYQRELQGAINDLKEAKGPTLSDERTRQEAVKLRLENEQRTTFLQTLLATLGAGVGLIVTAAGIWIGFAQYMTAKERDRLDRASKDLEQLWEGIAAYGNPSVQAAAIAALQHFLSPDKHEYHDRVAAALALAGRMENRSPVVNHTITPILEKAMRQITDNMRKVSWQGLHLKSADFSGIDLNSFDFRDSELEEIDLRGCNLKRARFDAARLVRARLENADLSEASLEYADLADASLRSANLENANLRHIQLMNLDLKDANLAGALLSHETDWRLSRDWRTARFPKGARERLLELHGPAASGPKVLMLMWEFLPNVSGGAWTAAYHLLRNLRQSGADICVAVPWSTQDVTFLEFGNEVPVLPLGDSGKALAGKFTTYESERAPTQPIPTFQYYSSAFERVQSFAKAAVEAVELRNLRVDIVHAHDWQTFLAAKDVSKLLGCPWVAHFHSIEKDRRVFEANSVIARIEKDGCDTANWMVVPSNITKSRLVDTYDANPARVEVVPNCLSPEEIVSYVPSQNFDAKRVAFVGRLSSQKGPDLFVKIARTVKTEMSACSFLMYGRGDMGFELYSLARGLETFKSPELQRVEPTPTNSPQRLSSPVSIERIAPVDFDFAGKRIKVIHAEKTGKHGDLLINLALSRGFVAYAVDDSTYSHVIQLNGEPGDGPALAIKATGLRTAERVRENDSVTFLDWLPWQYRKRAFQNASLIVVPSRSEPFGMVVLEAMQQGIPVLFPKDAGVGEVVKAGLRIDPENTSEVAHLIVELLTNEEQWQRNAEAELIEIRQYPDRQYEQKLMELWVRLLNGTGQS